MKKVTLNGEGEVNLLETDEEVGNRIPGFVGVGVTPKGIPMADRKCYSCGAKTNNWFGFRDKDPWHPSQIYFLCPKCESGYDED